MRVLVVDDQTFVAELVKLALEADGHACYAARATGEAAEIVRAVRLDLVVLDLVSGGSDPIAWIEEVVLELPQLHGRIVLLSATEPGESERLRMAGCGARVMAKPFTLHGLRRLVSEMGSAEPAGDAPRRPRPPESPLTEDA